MSNLSYCTFVDTGKTFNNKKVYRCSYCNTQLALENPNTNIICFKKHNEIINYIDNMGKDPRNTTLNLHAESDAHFKSLIEKELEKSKINPADLTQTEQTEQMEQPKQQDLLCSKEQIDYRLKICNTCQHFKDNSCLLCGCVVVRDKNFNNKLAHKNHSCPINKWGPID